MKQPVTPPVIPPVTRASGADAISVELSSRRTGMSFQRTRMSADRTLMSVIRTSLSLISFGFTIYQLFLKLAESKVVESGSGDIRRFGAMLVILGIGMLISGIIYHISYMLELRSIRHSMTEAGLIHGASRYPISLTLVVAILMLVLGFFAITTIFEHANPFR